MFVHVGIWFICPEKSLLGSPLGGNQSVCICCGLLSCNLVFISRPSTSWNHCVVLSWRKNLFLIEHVREIPTRSQLSHSPENLEEVIEVNCLILAQFSSSVVKRKEKLAVTQLKTKQLLREQELKQKITELQHEKEFVEAQKEKAIVSLEVYK